MRFFEMLQKIERVDRLIRLKATGNATQLACRLNISERSTHRLLNTMKKMGAPIYYNYAKSSYCYNTEVEFKIGFSLSNTLSQKINGGEYLWKNNFINILTKSGSEFDYFYCSTLKGDTENPEIE